jgi:hypothetical protein
MTDVLLEDFDHYQVARVGSWPLSQIWWYQLVHVCRMWRKLARICVTTPLELLALLHIRHSSARHDWPFTTLSARLGLRTPPTRHMDGRRSGRVLIGFATFSIGEQDCAERPGITAKSVD